MRNQTMQRISRKMHERKCKTIPKRQEIGSHKSTKNVGRGMREPPTSSTSLRLLHHHPLRKNDMHVGTMTCIAAEGVDLQLKMALNP